MLTILQHETRRLLPSTTLDVRIVTWPRNVTVWRLSFRQSHLFSSGNRVSVLSITLAPLKLRPYGAIQMCILLLLLLLIERAAQFQRDSSGAG